MLLVLFFKFSFKIIWLSLLAASATTLWVYFHLFCMYALLLDFLLTVSIDQTENCRI